MIGHSKVGMVLGTALFTLCVYYNITVGPVALVLVIGFVMLDFKRVWKKRMARIERIERINGI